MAPAAASRLAVGQGRRGQLPAEVTGFVGRHAELARLSSLLASTRLVTVTGPAGVGKTRVALRAAALAAGRYADGVCFVELSGLRDPALLPGAVADCLGLRTHEDLPALLGHLRDRRQLLVLDTCEHIVDGCAMFAEAVLRDAAGIAMLTTSRQPLDVPGEHTLPVTPLPVSGAGDPGDGHDAVALFAQRAAAAVPSFRLTGETRPDVMRLCRRLDGLPLAIELAAIRLRALPLPELTIRLQHPFRVLDGARRGAVPRHQTLSTAIGWSYDLCTPQEQALWARLSVFAGPFDVKAAEYVCSAQDLPGDPEAGPGAGPGARPDVAPGAGPAEIISPLIRLVDKSVLLRDDAPGTRYRLPGTLREFGARRLADAGADAACRERHLSYYLAAARRFRAELSAGGRRHRARELRASHEDLRAALAHEMSPESGTRPGLAMALLEYWVISGRLHEGAYWLGKVIERFQEPSPERARALVGRAFLLALQGEAGQAARDAGEGTLIARHLRATRLAARGYLHLHTALTLGGRQTEAAAAGAEAERQLTALHDDTGLVLLAVHRAHLSQLDGRPDEAIRQCEQALGRLEAGDEPAAGKAPGNAAGGAADSGDRWLRGCLHTIAALAYLQMPGQEDRCAVNAVRALRTLSEVGDVIGTAYVLEVLASLAASSGRLARAAWLIGAADPLWERTGKRLSGTEIMLRAHERAVASAAGGLGEGEFAALRARGAACALDEIVTAAADDADDVGALPSPARGQADGQAATAAGRGEQPAPTDHRGPDGQPVPTGRRGPAGQPAPAAAQPAGGGQEPDHGLTGRELEIAALVANGLANREIAAKLVISKRTVDAHVEHIFGKLGLSSRVQLTLWFTDQLHTVRAPSPPATGRETSRQTDN